MAHKGNNNLKEKFINVTYTDTKREKVPKWQTVNIYVEEKKEEYFSQLKSHLVEHKAFLGWKEL